MYPTLLTTYGLVENSYAANIRSVVVMDDLFHRAETDFMALWRNRNSKMYSIQTHAVKKIIIMTKIFIIKTIKTYK